MTVVPHRRAPHVPALYSPDMYVPDIIDDATRRDFLVGGASLAALLAAAACGADGGGLDAERSTRSVDTALGEVEIPVDPRRVVAMYVTDLDYALVLDLPVVGAGAAQGASDQFASYQPVDRLTDVEPLTTYPEANLEQVAAVRPDVIIDSRAVEQDEYRTLTEIAPTVNFSEQMFGGEGEFPDWRRALRYLAEGFGRTEQAEAYIEMFQARVNGLRRELAGPIGAGTFAVTTPYDGQLYVQTSADLYLPRTLTEDLGFTLPEAVVEIGAGEAEVVISPEQYELLQVDWLFVLTYAGEDGTADLDQVSGVTDNPLWQRLPAVEAGHVILIDSEINFPSPLGTTAFVDAIDEAILS